MVTYDAEERERALEEEHPGPSELESALADDKLSDVAPQAPLIVPKTASIADAIRLMQRERHASVLIVEDRRLIGVFTERDVLMKVAGCGIDIERTPVTACMTPDPITLPADASVAYALNKMVTEGFRHIPLVDSAGRPTGVVSMRQMIEYLGEIYAKELLTIPPDPKLVNARTREGA
ncbi:MAG TPA: CBS domain-containing protein [Candidatus Binataceae bacterium]|nr:CBS domain-containing protein [Candidatus Binataceae bacterium]